MLKFFFFALITFLDQHYSIQFKELTAYAYTASVEECDSDPFTTASGETVQEGLVAVSRDLQEDWNFGTKLYIKGIKVLTVEDTMNERHKNSLDIFMNEKKDAKEFGIQKVTVFEIRKRK
jgi:3D (Asp-Asp-Asp) domain-containing protein